MTLTAEPVLADVEPISGDTARHLKQAITEIPDGAPHYAYRRKMYEGKIKEIFASARLMKRLAAQGSAYRVNMARRPIDAITDKLEVSSIAVAGEKPDGKLTQLIQSAIYDANELDLDFPDWIMWTIVYGDYYAIEWNGQEDGTVDVFGHSPETVKVWYQDDNPKVIRNGAQVWVEGDNERKIGRVTLYYHDRIERYITGEGLDVRKVESYQLLDDEGIVENPHGRPPVFHFRTGKPYGEPLHRDAFGPQNAMNKLLITMMSTIDFHGAGQRWVLTDAPTDDTDEYDEDDYRIDDTESDPPDRGAKTADHRGQKSELSNDPGAVWWLRYVKATGVYPAADPEVFLKPMDKIIRIMSVITSTPMKYFDPVAAASGESKKEDNEPNIKRCENVQRRIAGTAAELFEFGLKLLGNPGHRVMITWKPLERVSTPEGWQGVKAKQDAGVPIEKALAEAGYLPEEVTEWMQSAEHQMRLVGALADVVSRIGTAVASGQLGEGEAMIMVQTLMGRVFGTEDGQAEPIAETEEAPTDDATR